MDARDIKKHLKKNVEIIIYDVATSSNTIAKELASKGAKEGTTVVVKSQTNGRGRLGRSFISNSENGLYMSIILRPKIPIDKCANITALASVAVLDAIESTSQCSCQIKWVNDIYINDKKVCGILTEASYNYEENLLDYVVCGIGVNISPPKNGFDNSIKDIAGAIFEKEAPSIYKSVLCASIIDTFFKYYNELEKKPYINKYKEKSSVIGKKVDVYRGDEIIRGLAIDINDNAELIVKTENGDICVFNSGEARVRKSGDKLSI